MDHARPSLHIFQRGGNLFLLKVRPSEAARARLMTVISSSQADIEEKVSDILARVYSPDLVFSSALSDDSLDRLRLYLVSDSY